MLEISFKPGDIRLQDLGQPVKTWRSKSYEDLPTLERPLEVIVDGITIRGTFDELLRLSHAVEEAWEVMCNEQPAPLVNDPFPNKE